MRVLVCGGRTFSDLSKKKRGTPEWDKADRERVFIFDTLDRLAIEANENLTIISGKAKGADTSAAAYARITWRGLEEYPADWENLGPAAGPIRNKQMIDEGRPDLVVAFPGGNGTADMVNKAKKARPGD